MQSQTRVDKKAFGGKIGEDTDAFNDMVSKKFEDLKGRIGNKFNNVRERMRQRVGGDDDEDGKTDIRQTFFGRKFHNIVNRAYREVAVFTAPGEFFKSGRATGIPLLTLGWQLGELGANTIDETVDIITGEDPYTNDDRKEKFYHTFKLIPGLNAFSKGIEMFPQQKYERY